MTISFPSSSYKSDIHLHPVYLKWAAEKFCEGNTSEAMEHFRSVCDEPRDIEYRVYQCLWRLRGSPLGVAEYGRNAFHDVEGLSSIALEKANAIREFLRGVSPDQIQTDEQQLYRWLWIVKGMPAGDDRYGEHAFHNTHGLTATAQQKALAIQLYVKESRPLTWLDSNYEVRLIQREGELQFLVLDGTTKTSRVGPIDLNGQSVAERVSQLSKCDVVLRGDGPPVFSSSQVIRKTENSVVDVRLQQTGNRLVWRLFDKTMRAISWIPVTRDATPVGRTFYSNDALLAAQRAYFRDFKTGSISSYEGKLLGVSLDKIRFSSVLDSTKTIDRDHWAVTLIHTGSCNSQNSKSNSSGWVGHAGMLIEKVKDGKHFLLLAHLTAEEGVCLSTHEITSTIINTLLRQRIKGKSETWLRTREQVGSMIARIEEEHNDPANHPVIFHPLGADSLLTESKVYVRGHGIMQMPPDFIAGLQYVGAVVQSIFSRLPNLPRWKSDSPIAEMTSRRLSQWKTELGKRYGSDKVLIVSPSSCISWARDKLSMVNVHLENPGTAWLVTMPIQHTVPMQA